MSIRIILVDDHAVVREGLARLLEGQPDLRIAATFGDAKAAIDYAQREEPDVAVVDVAMPGLNGIELARRMHDVSPATHIVMLSMHADVEYVHRSMLAGAQAYVVKGASGQALIDAVRAVVAGRRYLSQQLDQQALQQLFLERGMSDPLDRLSAREREVLQLTVEGKTISEAAAFLNLSPKSIETYRSRLMSKLDLEDLPSLVKFAIRNGITSVD